MPGLIAPRWQTTAVRERTRGRTKNQLREPWHSASSRQPLLQHSSLCSFALSLFLSRTLPSALCPTFSLSFRAGCERTEDYYARARVPDDAMRFNVHYRSRMDADRSGGTVSLIPRSSKIYLTNRNSVFSRVSVTLEPCSLICSETNVINEDNRVK